MDAMTSAQTMQVSFVRPLAVIASVAIALGSGCAHDRDRLTAPSIHTAPYDTSRGDVLWAVAPLRNESGTTLVDEMAISDEIVSAAAQVRGVRCLPLNRTILAMRALEMDSVDTPEDLKTLAMEMGVDGILVGSVTAYDPYDPPTLGLSLALYARAGHLQTEGTEALDTRQLVYQPTDYQYFANSNFDDAPASVISDVLDARGHDVQMRIQSYASGRTEEISALGWRRYMASMVLYTKFAAWHSVGRLVDHERLRLARSPRLTRASSG
jgi:hypothetical protein